jgi:FeS assembly SUF system protein
MSRENSPVGSGGEGASRRASIIEWLNHVEIGVTTDPVALKAQVIEALRGVYDPEIPVNIYDLGLVYRCDVDDNGVVEVDMTLTAPGCPVAQSFPGTVEAAIRKVPGVTAARVDLVWDPPWCPDRLSDEAKLELGLL